MITKYFFYPIYKSTVVSSFNKSPIMNYLISSFNNLFCCCNESFIPINEEYHKPHIVIEPNTNTNLIQCDKPLLEIPSNRQQLTTKQLFIQLEIKKYELEMQEIRLKFTQSMLQFSLNDVKLSPKKLFGPICYNKKKYSTKDKLTI